MAKGFWCVKHRRTIFFINVDFLIENAVFANELRGIDVLIFAPIHFCNALIQVGA